MKRTDNSLITPNFSEAELRVVELLSKGRSEKEIANELNLSFFTVNNHMRNIRKKNGVSKNIEILFVCIAYLKKQKFSLKMLREIGLSSIMILVNVCQYVNT